MNTGYIIKNNIAYGLGGGGGDSMAQEVLASTLTQLGVPTESDASFTTINENIFVLAEQKYDEGNEDGVAQSMVGDAVASEVLSGKTFTTKNDVGITGTMANQGAKSTSLNAGGSYTIPAGYHNGSGTITANSLASQTSATAAAADIASGKTAYVNGSKITGTGYTLGTPSVVATRYTDSNAAFTANVTNGKKYLLLADGATSRGPGTTSPTLSGVTGFSYSKITTVKSGNCGYAIFLITATSSSISVAGNGHHLYWTLIAI